MKTATILSCLMAFVSTQAQYGLPENSAAVLAALKEVNGATVSSGAAAEAYQPGDDAATRNLTFENYVLRSDWQYVQYVAQSSPGFYSDLGAQNIVDFINNELYPNTRAADKIYTDKRDVFIAGGFIQFIKPGLIQLRLAVADASAAIKGKTPASKLTPLSRALLTVEQNYADTQEFQQFGGAAPEDYVEVCSSSSSSPSSYAGF